MANRVSNLCAYNIGTCIYLYIDKINSFKDIYVWWSIVTYNNKHFNDTITDVFKKCRNTIALHCTTNNTVCQFTQKH